MYVREIRLRPAPRLFLFVVSLGAGTLASVGLVSGFDVRGWSSSFWASRSERSAGLGSRSGSESDVDPEPPPTLAASGGVESPPIGVSSDSAEALRRTVLGLIPLPSLPERDAQARIDELAVLIAGMPALAPLTRDIVDELIADNHSDAAEGAFAALGRTEVGASVLRRATRDGRLSKRLRGAAFLSLVQPREVGGLASTRPCFEAYARAPRAVTDERTRARLLDAFDAWGPRFGKSTIESDRLIDACSASGILDPRRVSALLEGNDVGRKLRLFAALARAEAVDERIVDLVRDQWVRGGDRTVRRAAVLVLARSEVAYWRVAVPSITDPSKPGAFRLDALAGLTPRRPIADADAAQFEGWLRTLLMWTEVEPTLRDDEPMADGRNGPNVTFVDASTRDRVAALASAVDLAAGRRSASLHDWATRLSESLER